MNSETLIVITIFALATVLGTWGASLIVRALASRASKIAMRLARRIPKRLNTAPPTLTPLQFWFGMIAGPIFAIGGSALAVFALGAAVQEGAREFRWSAIPAVLTVMLAVGALVVGLRWDMARGRRRCPKCWYDFTGLADDAPCPECGHVPGSAKALSRTRRSRGVLVAAPVLLALAWVAYVTPAAMRTSWREFVPTTVMIGFFEYMPDSLLSGAMGRDDGSLGARLASSRVATWQRHWLGRRALRIVRRSSDPRACAFATYYAFNSGTPINDDQLDTISANLLRVGFDPKAASDPKASAYQASILHQSVIVMGPKSREAFEANRAIALSRFKTPVGAWDHAVYGRMIGWFDSPTDETMASVRAVALDPQWQVDRRDQAAALLGLLACKDPAALDTLEAEYAQSQGATREMLAIALLSAQIQRIPASTNPTNSPYAQMDPELDRTNSAKIAQVMRGSDPAMRRAAAKIVVATQRLTFPAIDLAQTSRDLVELAKADPECAATAIHGLVWNGGVPDDLVPVVARVLDSGTVEDVAAIAEALRWSQLDADWLAIRDALGRRVSDPALDQASRAALLTAQSKLDAIAPQAHPEAQP